MLIAITCFVILYLFHDVVNRIYHIINNNLLTQGGNMNANWRKTTQARPKQHDDMYVIHYEISIS